MFSRYPREGAAKSMSTLDSDEISTGCVRMQNRKGSFTGSVSGTLSLQPSPRLLRHAPMCDPILDAVRQPSTALTQLTEDGCAQRLNFGTDESVFRRRNRLAPC